MDLCDVERVKVGDKVYCTHGLKTRLKKVGSCEGGALTLGDCQRALKNEVLYDLLEFVVRRILGDEGSMSADKRPQLGELLQELVGQP